MSTTGGRTNSEMSNGCQPAQLPLSLSARRLVFFILPVVAMANGGCETNARTGSLIGAGLGAAVGNWIGDDTEGTLIGAGAGAAAGYMIGNEADKDEAREEDHKDAAERNDDESSDERS